MASDLVFRHQEGVGDPKFLGVDNFIRGAGLRRDRTEPHLGHHEKAWKRLVAQDKPWANDRYSFGGRLYASSACADAYLGDGDVERLSTARIGRDVVMRFGADRDLGG